jgi:bacteriocin biosynthesis cyclodehydratase domain-containing protein
LEFEPIPVKYRALPVQVFELRGLVILKRGRVETVVNGEGAAELVRDLLDSLSESGATVPEIIERFDPLERQAVGDLVAHLIRNGMLISEDEISGAADDESELDIFYWHFGERGPSVAERLNSQRFLIVGCNTISRRLIAELRNLKVSNFQVIDYPPLRNLRVGEGQASEATESWGNVPLVKKQSPDEIDPERFDILIACSDFGGLSLLREWNEFCVLHDRFFFPVVLQDLVGYVGPLVMPRKTACFECFLLRRDANINNPALGRAAEFTAFDGQHVIGFHPSMASMLGDIAAFELTKFYGLNTTTDIGSYIEVNLLEPTMSARRVLRLPRCPVCTSLKERASAVTVKSIFTNGAQAGE